MSVRSHGICCRCGLWNGRWLTWCNYCDTGPYCLGDCGKDHAKQNQCFSGFRGRPKKIWRSEARTSSGVGRSSNGSRGDRRHTAPPPSIPDGAPADDKMPPLPTPRRLIDMPWWSADDSSEVRDTWAQGSAAWLSSADPWPCPNAECVASTRPNYGNRKVCRKCGVWKPCQSTATLEL